jgi:hypothetical protein
MAEWDTLAIQERVLRDARVPRGSLYDTLDNLLPLLDQHLRTVIVPKLLDAGEDYLSATQTYAVTAGQGTYRLPTRSLRLLEVSLVGPDGRPRAYFSRATSTQVTKFRSYGRVRPTGPVEFWWFEASAVQVYPAPSTTDGSTLVLRYARRPSRLVSPVSCGVVTQTVPVVIPGNNRTRLYFEPMDSFGDPDGADMRLDLVKGTPGFEAIADNQNGMLVQLTPAPGINVTVFDAYAELSTIEAGDYLCPVGTSPVPQVPLDYLTALEHSVVAQLLRANGDMDAAAAAEAALQATLVSAVSNFAPRADEATTVVQQDW